MWLQASFNLRREGWSSRVLWVDEASFPMIVHTSIATTSDAASWEQALVDAVEFYSRLDK